MMLQNIGGDAGKVFGMLAHLLASNLRTIRQFRAQIDLVAGDAPIPMSTGPAFLVELQVVRISGITMVAAPYLNPRPRIAGVKRDMSVAVRRFGIVRAIKVFLRTV